MASSTKKTTVCEICAARALMASYTKKASFRKDGVAKVTAIANWFTYRVRTTSQSEDCNSFLCQIKTFLVKAYRVDFLCEKPVGALCSAIS